MNNDLFKSKQPSQFGLEFIESDFRNQRNFNSDNHSINEFNSGNEFFSSWGYCAEFRFFALSNDYNPKNWVMTDKLLKSNLENAQNFRFGKEYVLNRIFIGLQKDMFLNYICSSGDVVLFKESVFGDKFYDFIEKGIASFLNLGDDKLLEIGSDGICRILPSACVGKHIIIFRGALIQPDSFINTCRKCMSLGSKSVTGIFMTRAVPTKDGKY